MKNNKNLSKKRRKWIECLFIFEKILLYIKYTDFKRLFIIHKENIKLVVFIKLDIIDIDYYQLFLFYLLYFRLYFNFISFPKIIILLQYHFINKEFCLIF